MIPFYEFLNDPDESHALIFGFREGFKNITSFYPSELPSGLPYIVDDSIKEYIVKEYHYYIMGFYLSWLVRLVVIITLSILGIDIYGL